ncbi:MAG: FADH(2)-oxidizing methylenetetrahydrofolate--tRNA-(uracil(54)-C(5))-methyltransferase TrmFO [Hydrogenothermaceae bacterium]|nr:FADH(2)-oxidizing methylenetetrahydrofolate--tRNA-(uracil(54)-C(5))-methyltransferase TrmFO [Hydrogenothermaceae bacterium]
MSEVIVIGGGLAGSETAYKIAQAGYRVKLFEMRPKLFTPVHRTPYLAEIVCSNSFGSMSETSASGLLKKEMEILDSIVLEVAKNYRVPAGQAFAVDREKFSKELTKVIENHPNIEVIREEVVEIPRDRLVVIASGPLTSERLSLEIQNITGSEHLYFYDAISPVVDASTVDYSKGFWGDRYGKGSGDYFNCTLTEEEYDLFYNELMKGEQVPLKDFERAVYFEGCLPIEEIARRGKQTLLFGPMKPVGLVDPSTEKQPFAVVQLRKENVEGTILSLVGFQTKLKYPDQKRIFRLIPALKDVEFVKLGSIHRNTFIQSQKLLKPTLQLRKEPNILFAGQITGVEGYMASAATGIIAGINIVRMLKGVEPVVPPRESMIGSLINYVTTAKNELQPMGPNFAVLPELEIKIKDKEKRKELKVKKAIEAINRYKEKINLQP